MKNILLLMTIFYTKANFFITQSIDRTAIYYGPGGAFKGTYFIEYYTNTVVFDHFTRNKCYYRGNGKFQQNIGINIHSLKNIEIISNSLMEDSATYSYLYPNATKAIIYTHYIFVCTLVIIFFFSAMRLCSSNNVQMAIGSFFINIFIIVIFIFYINSDYVAVITAMVYIGAVLIFFVFILITIDPKSFKSTDFYSGRINSRNNRQKNIDLQKFFGFLSFFVSFSAVCLLNDDSETFHYCKSIKTYFYWQEISTTPVESSPILSFGEAMFGQYFTATFALAIILFSVLILAMVMLTTSKTNLIPSFGKNFVIYE